jgi:hypothetical protein
MLLELSLRQNPFKYGAKWTQERLKGRSKTTLLYIVVCECNQRVRRLPPRKVLSFLWKPFLLDPQFIRLELYGGVIWTRRPLEIPFPTAFDVVCEYKLSLLIASVEWLCLCATRKTLSPAFIYLFFQSVFSLKYKRTAPGYCFYSFFFLDDPVKGALVAGFI